MTFMDSFLVPLSFFLGIVYLLGPLLLYFSFKLLAESQVRPLDFSKTSLSPRLKEFFASTRQNMAQMGFQFAGYFEAAVSRNQIIILGLFQHPSTRDAGMSMAHFQRMANDLRLRGVAVSFGAGFEDDSQLGTNNNADYDVMGKSKNWRIVQVPPGTASHLVFRTHRYLAGLHLQGSQKTADMADPAGFIRRSFQKSYHRQVPLGYLKPSRDGKVLRPTLKGAFFIWYKWLWPLRWVIKNRARLEGEDCLQKALAAEVAVTGTGFVPEQPLGPVRESAFFSPAGMRNFLRGLFLSLLVVDGYYHLVHKGLGWQFDILALLAAVGLVILWLVKPRLQKNSA